MYNENRKNEGVAKKRTKAQLLSAISYESLKRLFDTRKSRPDFSSGAHLPDFKHHILSQACWTRPPANFCAERLARYIPAPQVDKL
jgi:hypothetical protein